MILQFIMKMKLIQHYEYSYQATTRDRPYGQNTPTMDFPKNYALRITNYELIQTRTSVRLYERAGSPDVWITPNNYEYALCINSQAILNIRIHLFRHPFCLNRLGSLKLDDY